MIECLSVLFQIYVSVWVFLVISWMIISNFIPGQSTKEVEHDLGFIMKLSFGWPVLLFIIVLLYMRSIFNNLKTIFFK